MNRKGLNYSDFHCPCPPNCESRVPACQDRCEKMKEAKKTHEEDKQRLKEMRHKEYVLNMVPKKR